MRALEELEALAEVAGGITRLRQMILGLALHGRLVEHVHGEGNAQALVKQIAGNLFSNSERDQESLPELPRHWTWVGVGEIADCVLGKMLDKAKHTRGTKRPYLRNINVRWGGFDLSDLKEMYFEDDELDRYGVRPGDVLICEGGEPGRAGVWTDKQTMLIQKAIHRVRLGNGVIPQWLVLNLRHDTWSGRLEQYFTGATIKHFTGRALESYTIRLAPTGEQERIVAKFDQFMALCDELEAKQRKKSEVGDRLTMAALGSLTVAEPTARLGVAWKRVEDSFSWLVDDPNRIEDLRLTCIDLASRGMLVTQDPGHAPAYAALEARKHQRRALWEKSQIDRFRRLGKAPRNDAWKQDYDEPEALNTESLPDLPTGWTYGTIGTLGLDLFGAVQTGPFGAQLHASEFVASGVPVIAVGNLTGTGFKTDGLYYITSDKAAQLDRYDVQAGDLLFARSGATLGKVCIAPSFVRDWRMTGHILRVRLDSSIIIPELAAFWLWGSAAVKEQIVSTIRGGTRPGYNTQLLEQIIIPVPPLLEQRRILVRIKELLSLCDDLEARLRARDEKAARLADALVAQILA